MVFDRRERFSLAGNIFSISSPVILVLIRLKPNPPFQDLAFCFNISLPTASRVFDKSIHSFEISH